MQPSSRRRTATVLWALASVVAAVAALSGLVVAVRYLPEPGRPVVAEVHRVALWIALGLAVSASVLTRRSGLGVVPGDAWSRRPLVAASAALLAVATSGAVEWDRLVMVVPGVEARRGLWFAATDEAVRWVLADGRQMPQATYAAVALLHLTAPFVSAVAAAVSAAALRRAQPPTAWPPPTTTGPGPV